MRLESRVFEQTCLKLAIAAMCLLTAVVLVPSWALALQANQSINQAATLVGPREKSPIPIYLRPAPNQPNVGYGINGDAVTVTEQMASFLPEADPSTTWNHIRLDNEPYTEGWVQGKFLSLEKADVQE
ncbi:MAG: hypothetical protein AAFQ76_18610 [Cyanobacteria bacterium J06626_26]